MSSHCPGFENNKSLTEITLKCPECSATMDIFSDELEKEKKCPKCATKIDPKSCQVDK